MSDRSCYGVSEIVGVILTTMIIASVVGGLLLWAEPAIEQKRTMHRFNSMINQFTAVSTVLQDIQRQGVNSSGAVTLSVDTGTFSVANRSGTRFVLYYPLGSGASFSVDGLDPSESSYDVNSFTVDRNNNTDIDVEVFRYPPGKKISSQTAINGPTNTFTIDPGCRFEGVLRVDMNFSTKKEVIGRIWIIDAGYLNFRTSSATQNRQVRIENGGLLAGSTPTVGYIYSGPFIMNSPDAFILRFLRFQSDSASSVSGSDDLDVKIQLKNNVSIVVENQQSVVSGEQISLQLFGNYRDAWKNYFDDECDLPFTGSEMKLAGPKQISLAFSEILVSFEVVA